MVCFSVIYVNSLSGEMIEHIFPPARLLTEMHEKHTIKKIACTNCLPDDEHMMFETYRRHRNELKH
jgi:hypothetical protein